LLFTSIIIPVRFRFYKLSVYITKFNATPPQRRIAVASRPVITWRAPAGAESDARFYSLRFIAVQSGVGRVTRDLTVDLTF
jgi:hypothetical protein